MNKINRTKYTCFFTYVAMSSVFSLPPMLFMTFHNMYGISYTLLGSLLLVNFLTQLLIDLVFTFFSKKFNIKLTIKLMPLITSFGLVIYALVPLFMPKFAIYGLVIGTIVFSVAAGLCEVLLSPLVAALPSDNPEKDMSALHSLYGWGVVIIVSISTLYFKIFTIEKWMYLALFWAFLPIISSILYCKSPIPDLSAVETYSNVINKSDRAKGLLICAVCIFLGSSSENIMTGWISSYMERALLIPKAIGDILGMAVFALMIAFTRTAYAKYGKKIYKVLIISMSGAMFCYLTSGICNNIIISFISCVLTGVFTSMLWPGTLIYMEEIVYLPGVAAYALMAAAGDLGAAFAPQMTGMIIDKISVSDFAIEYSKLHNYLTDQVGLKFGMLFSAIFPLLGLIWLILCRPISKQLKNNFEVNNNE